MVNKIENRIFTIGHSTRKLDELVAVLRCYNVLALVDVRNFPSSKRNPQFNKNNVEIKLQESGIQYYWIEELGGFREGGYEKYMDSEDFKSGVKKLIEIAKQKTAAIMCAELLWFRCHRASIASLLTKNGWDVAHIFDEKRSQTHKLRKEP
jgi:uncharacterized protein (DUF488 family)